MKQYLQNHRIITDGSFGTYYAQRYDTTQMPELANTQHPERVKEIHREYLQAGAKLIRTNTFAANTRALEGGFEKVKENVERAVALAREALQEAVAPAGAPVFIAGDIGPIGPGAEEEYCDLVRIFLENEVRVITFETFPDMEEILPAIRLAKAGGAFVMVQFCVNQFGYSSLGLSAKKLLAKACAVEKIDAAGFNCGVGPGHMERILQTIPSGGNKFFIALPNAGYPRRQKGMLQFHNQPEYFADAAAAMCGKYGLDILGGCCGTTPAFIRELSLRVQIARKKRWESVAADEGEKQQRASKAFFLDENGMEKPKKLIAAELAPPFNGDDEQLLSAAWRLKAAKVDVITFPDSPSGRTRIDSVLMAAKVKRETGVPVMPHLCCRDKNAIAMRSLFLGADVNDIHNLLIITGDPVPAQSRQSVKGVFNFDAVGLMNIAKDMNGESMTRTPITYGGAINQGRRNLDVEILRVKKKMEAGAEFFLTQPVFSKEDAERVRRIKEETGARILCGVMPLISRRNALFMKNEIAGVSVPAEVVERFPEGASREAGEAVGIALAKEVMAMTESFADGYYFSFPFNRVHMLEEILKG